MDVPEPSVFRTASLGSRRSAPSGSARSIPQLWRKVSRHVIRTVRRVRTCVEVQTMYARFTEGTIDPKKREQTEMIVASIFTAARKQKGFKGVSFCLDPKGEAVFLSRWESEEAMQANEVSGSFNDEVAKLKDGLTTASTRHVR